MDLLLDAKLLLLLTCANGTPVVARAILGAGGAVALDGSLRLNDGERLLGPSKTIRGVLFALAATSAVAKLLGLGWRIGLVLASTAMLGDLGSSFTKRRLGLPASSRATGLDQIPESLLPLLVLAKPLVLSVLDIASTTVCFFVGEVLLSRVLFRVHIRDRPY